MEIDPVALKNAANLLTPLMLVTGIEATHSGGVTITVRDFATDTVKRVHGSGRIAWIDTNPTPEEVAA